MNTTTILIIILCALIIFAIIFIKRINSKKDKEENPGKYYKQDSKTEKKPRDEERSFKSDSMEHIPQKKKTEPELPVNKNTGANINFSRDKKEKPNVNETNTKITDEELKASDFIFLIDDVFDIYGKGVVVSGMVYKGQVKLNDRLTLRKKSGEKKLITVIKIEKFKSVLTEANVKDVVGIIITGAIKTEISKHDVLLSVS